VQIAAIVDRRLREVSINWGISGEVQIICAARVGGPAGNNGKTQMAASIMIEETSYGVSLQLGIGQRDDHKCNELASLYFSLFPA